MQATERDPAQSVPGLKEVVRSTGRGAVTAHIHRWCTRFRRLQPG